MVYCEQKKVQFWFPHLLHMLFVTKCLPSLLSSSNENTDRTFWVSLQGPIPTQAVSSVEDHGLDLLVQ